MKIRLTWENDNNKSEGGEVYYHDRQGAFLEIDLSINYLEKEEEGGKSI